jgi:hypothetical protein
MFPEEEGTEREGRVRAVYTAKLRLIGFQDPDMGNIFIRRDEAVGRLRYDPELGQVVDSFGNPVDVGGMAFPAKGYSYEFKYKTAEYLPLTVNPEDFQAAPGTTLQLRLVIVDGEGNIHVLYKSFGENRSYDPDIEQQMIGEAVGAVVPGQKTVNINTPPMEGIEISKSYTVMRVSPKRLGP